MKTKSRTKRTINRGSGPLLFPQPKKHPCLTLAFWGLLANNFLYLFGYQIVLVHLVKHLINEGVFDDGNAGVAISAIGLFNMLGR